jgi:hypothetical protein
MISENTANKAVTAVVNYVGEDEEFSVDMNTEFQIFDANLALNSLSVNQTLPKGFLKAPTPYIRIVFGKGFDEFYGLVDTGSQINLLSHRLANQLNLPVETGNFDVNLNGAGGLPVDISGLCHDVLVNAVGQPSLQTFLVTPSTANDLILGLPWFLQNGAKITSVGKGKDAGVSVSVVGRDGRETSVVAILSKELMRTPEGLVPKN